MDIQILDSVNCEVQPALATIIKPLLSFTAVYYTQGFFKKERHEYEKTIMIKRKSGTYLFPTGLLPKVVKYCVQKNVPIKVIGKEEKLPYSKPTMKTLTLRDEQVRLVNSALKKQRGVLVAPTGVGKTALGIAVISSFVGDKDFKALWLCHTKDLMYQSAEVCKKELGIEPGIVGDNSSDLSKQITMATRQSFINHVEKYGHIYDMVLVDEAHHISSYVGQYGSLLERIYAPIRIGLTATLPTQNKEAMLAIEGLLGPVIDEVTMEEGQDKNLIADIKIRIIKIPFSSDIKRLRNYADVYKFGVTNRPDQHIAIVQKAKEHVERGDSVLIIVTKLDHGRMIASQCYMNDLDAEFIQGADTAEDRDRVKRALDSKKLKCVIATTIWKEGVNIPELNVIINAAGGKSEIATIQAIGRGLRRTSTKKEIIVYDCMDSSHKYLIEHYGHRMAIYSEMGWI
jgi:superfamily II DNA or RNA helicase